MSGKTASGVRPERQVTVPLHGRLGLLHYKLTDDAVAGRLVSFLDCRDGLVLVKRLGQGADPSRMVTVPAARARRPGSARLVRVGFE